VVSADTVEQLLADGVDPVLVQNSPETLYLYATRLPEDARNNAPVENFGEVLDTVDGHSIVRVESVPAVVTDLANAGIWVQKVMPAAPEVADLQPVGDGPSISNIELGVLLPEVDSGRIEQ